MKPWLPAVLCMAWLQPAHAEDGYLGEREILSAPKTFVGRMIRIDAAGCVDPGGSGFVCAKQASGQLIVVQGGGLGARTDLSIAELLVERCKGTANLTARPCQMTVKFQLQGVEREMVEIGQSSVQRTVLHTHEVELEKPQARRR